MVLPAAINLAAYRGDTWAQTFRFKYDTAPLDLTGATVAAQARDGSTTTSLVVTVTNPTGGEVQVALPAGSLPAGSYSYDIEVTKAGQVTTWVRGQLVLTRDVTNEMP